MAKYNDLTIGQMEAAINIMGGWDNFQRLLRGELVVKAKEIVASVLKLLVNYGRSVKDGIAAGKYDWVNDNITDKNFPSKQSGETEAEIQLVHFNKVMSTDEVLRRLDEQGLRPATLLELLAIGEKHPELQREFPIVELGSFWVDTHGGRDVAYLCGDGRERGLDLGWCGGDWSEDARFAAVSK